MQKLKKEIWIQYDDEINYINKGNFGNFGNQIEVLIIDVNQLSRLPLHKKRLP